MIPGEYSKVPKSADFEQKVVARRPNRAGTNWQRMPCKFEIDEIHGMRNENGQVCVRRDTKNKSASTYYNLLLYTL